MSKVEKEKWLQVRMSEDEKIQLDELASAYRLDMSTFIREAIRYFDAKRPPLEVVPDTAKQAH